MSTHEHIGSRKKHFLTTKGTIMITCFTLLTIVFHGTASALAHCVRELIFEKHEIFISDKLVTSVTPRYSW